MKKLAVVIFLLLCTTTSIYGQKTRYGRVPPKAKPGVDYPIAIHISGIHIRQYCKENWGEKYASCDDVVYADVIIKGMKIEMMGYKYAATPKYLESPPGV
jgi:hypothetical protein